MCLSTKSVIFLLVSCLNLLSLVSAELCQAAADGDPAHNCTLTDWIDNIQCRLNGGNANRNGYIQWAFEITPQGVADRKNKFFAMKFFNNVKEDLATLGRAPVPTEERQLEVLERIERQINDWGQRLARMQPTENWNQSPDGCFAGVVLSTPVVCGDRQNRPDCVPPN